MPYHYALFLGSLLLSFSLLVDKKYPYFAVLCPRFKPFKKFQIRPVFVPWVQKWVDVKLDFENSTLTKPRKNVKFSFMEAAMEIKTSSTHCKNAMIFANQQDKVAKDPKIMKHLIRRQKVIFFMMICYGPNDMK